LNVASFANSLVDLRRDAGSFGLWASQLDWDFLLESNDSKKEGEAVAAQRSYSMAGRLSLSPSAHHSQIQTENLAAGVKALLGGARRGAGRVR
jgi:hypothetical protein